MRRIWSFGSINADHAYRVPHIPAPGETLAATGYVLGLGGKGANQSGAAARAGARVAHIGQVGPEGQWAVDRMRALGVDVTHVRMGDVPTGHAIICVDDAGENAITLFPGANRANDLGHVAAALAGAAPGDLLILQNETNLVPDIARIGQEQGLFVIYSAAPFDADAARDVMPYVSLLLLNAVEAAQLRDTLGDFPVGLRVVITKGADGADWIAPDLSLHVPALPATPVDTTGAGDTFAGYLSAGLAEGMDPAAAMRLATRAAAIKVTRAGTADAIPARAEVDAL
jgi:ribokinase